MRNESQMRGVMSSSSSSWWGLAQWPRIKRLHHNCTFAPFLLPQVPRIVVFVSFFLSQCGAIKRLFFGNKRQQAKVSPNVALKVSKVKWRWLVGWWLDSSQAQVACLLGYLGPSHSQVRGGSLLSIAQRLGLIRLSSELCNNIYHMNKGLINQGA